MNSVAAMFFILSFFLYARARLAEKKGKKWMLFAGCAVSGLLSLGSKEIAATLPFFILLYEWYFFQDLNWSWLKGRVFLFLGITIIFTAVALVYLGASPVEAILSSYASRDFTLSQRVLTEFRVVLFYISLLLFPHPSRLNLDHDFPLSHSLVDPVTTILSIVAIVGLVGLAVYLARRERLLSFCILWFLGNLVIESSVYGLEIIFEHRTYLPSMLAILLAVVLASRVLKQKWLAVGVLCTVVLVFSFWTYERNSVWRDHETLWRDSVAKSPKKARTHNNLGNILSDQGKLDEAISHFSEALRLDPESDKVHYNLGSALRKKGKIGEAITHYQEALRINPHHLEARNNLGNALVDKGEFEEAVDHFSAALRLDPNSKEVHYNLGNLYKTRRKFDEAIEQYEKALVIQPEYFDAMNNLALVYVKKGEYDKALPLYMKMIELQPNSFVAYYNMACMYAKQNMVDDSVGWLKQAVTRGFKDWDFLRTDEDLKNVRHTSYFKELTASRRNHFSN
jgi:Flp pilus assembly protein TadD